MKQSDPTCIRAEAVELLLSVLPDGDMVWLAYFADDVVPETPRPIQLAAGVREQLAAAAKHCSASGVHTNIARALESVTALVSTMPSETKESYIPRVLLLTDGAHEGSESLPQAFARLDAAGAELRVLALGTDAQTSLSVGTRGLTQTTVIPARVPRDLLAEFLASARMASGRWLIFDKHEQPGQVSVAVPSWASDWRVVFVPDVPSSGQSSIASGFEGTAVHRRSFSSLQGKPPQSLRLTVMLPAAGRLIADGAGDILLQSRIPAVVPSAVPFLCRARIVHKEGEDLGSAAFVSGAVINVRWSQKSQTSSATFLYDDGMHFDGKANDGEFAGTCTVDGDGQTPWAMSFSGPYATSLKGSGSATILARPLEIGWPNVVRRAVAAIQGRPAVIRLRNLTDVEMKVALRTERGSDQHLLGVRQEAEYPVPGMPNAVFSGRVPLTVLAEGAPAALWTGSVIIGGRMAIPALVVCIVVLVGLATFLPRRSAEGSTIQVRARETDSEDGFVATGVVGADGRVQFKEAPPAPYGELGRFIAQSGIFRSGVRYEPAPWMTPNFDGKTGRSGTEYVLLGAMSTWSVDHKGRKVSYTFSRR